MTMLQVTLPGAVTGDLEFPALSRWGVGVDLELVAYFDALDAAGTNMTAERVNAWIAFSETLKTAGLWSKLMEVYPLFGDNAASARIPALRRLSGSSALLTYPAGNADALFTISGGQVVRLTGTGSVTTNRHVLAPVTMAQLRTKTADFGNQSAYRWGRTVLHGNVGTAGDFRMGVYGLASPSGDWFDITRVAAASTTAYNTLALAGRSVGARSRPTDALAYSHVSLGASHFSDYTGAFSGPTFTANAPAAEREATAFTLGLQPSLNSQTLTTNGSTVSYTASADTEAVNYVSYDDGTIASQAQQEAYRAAIAALRAALYP